MESDHATAMRNDPPPTPDQVKAGMMRSMTPAQYEARQRAYEIRTRPDQAATIMATFALDRIPFSALAELVTLGKNLGGKYAEKADEVHRWLNDSTEAKIRCRAKRALRKG